VRLLYCQAVRTTPTTYDLTPLHDCEILHYMKRNPNPNKARKEIEHKAFAEACANGWRPQRAATFVNRKKEADRKACRNRKDWQ
jgi:hypothetical protein